MKLNISLPLCAVALAAALFPHAALADNFPVSITFNAATQTVGPNGGTLSFSGTVSNNGTATEYFIGPNVDLADPNGYSINSDAAFNNIPLLAAGDSYTGDLFTVTLSAGQTLGAFYTGKLDFLGGTDPNYGLSDNATLTSANTGQYVVSIQNPPAAVTPEPSSLVLLGTGALGAAGILRRRFLR